MANEAIKIKKILEAGKIVYPATILDAVRDASKTVDGKDNGNYGKSLREILAAQASAGSAEVDALDKQLHGNADGATDAEKAGELKTLETTVKAYTDTELGKLDATDNISEAVAGVAVQVDQENGQIAKPVVTVADNTVTYTAKVDAAEGVDAVARNLAAASTTNVLKGDAIASIKSYVDATVAEAGSDAADSLEALETKLYGEDGNGGDVKDINDAISALEATHAKKEDGEFKTVAEEADDRVTALINGAPEALDTLKEIADWIANQDESGVTDAPSLVARVDGLVEEIGDDDTEGSVKGRITALEALAGTDSVADQIADAIDALGGTATGSDNTAAEGEDSNAKVTVTVSSENGEVSDVTVVTNDIASAALLGATTDAATANTAFGKIAANAAAIQDNADAIGVASTDDASGTGLTGRIEVLESYFGEGDGTVANQIKAAVEALDVETNVSNAVKGVTVAVTEKDGKVEKPVVEVTAATVTFTAASGSAPSSLGATANDGNVLDTTALSAIKSYVDDRFSTAACADETNYPDVFGEPVAKA